MLSRMLICSDTDSKGSDEVPPSRNVVGDPSLNFTSLDDVILQFDQWQKRWIEHKQKAGKNGYSWKEGFKESTKLYDEVVSINSSMNTAITMNSNIMPKRQLESSEYCAKVKRFLELMDGIVMLLEKHRNLMEEQMKREEKESIDFYNWRTFLVDAHELTITSDIGSWGRKGTLTECAQELKKVLSSLREHFEKVKTLLGKIDEENLRDKVPESCEKLQSKLSTMTNQMDELSMELVYLNTALESNENAEQTLKDNVKRCKENHKITDELDQKYAMERFNVKPSDPNTFPALRDSVRIFWNSYEQLRLLLPKSPILWQQMSPLHHIERYAVKTMTHVCVYTPELICYLWKDLPDHKDSNCGCEYSQKEEKNSDDDIQAAAPNEDSSSDVERLPEEIID